MISYYNSEGLGYFPYIQGVWGCAPTSSICRRTNRMLALNSKNLNFHFATQSGMIIEKKTLLSQPWIKNSLWFLGNTSYSKNPHDIFLYHGDFLFFLYLLACQYLYYKNFIYKFLLFINDDLCITSLCSILHLSNFFI